MSNELQTGDKAPAFKLPRDGGGEVSLSDFAGKTVILYFYPKDDKSGCTKEAIAFSELKQAFDAENAVILGVSRDSVARHDKFRDKYDLSIALLSDEDGSVCENYGVWKEKKMYGKTFMGIERSTFLIGADGKLAQIWRKVRVPGHAEAVLEAVKAL